MSCPFCLSEPLPVSGYECGSGPNRSQRTDDCYRCEISRLRDRIDDLDGSLAEWKDYAEGLEESGDAMKEGATTRDQIAWERQLKRRPLS